MKELADIAIGAGAAGVMVAPPGTARTDAQIIDYFQAAADALGDIPFVLQDFPLATGVQIASGVIGEIVRRLPSCVMLKHEDWPGLDKITALPEAERAGGRRISILSRNGGLFLPEELRRGADGAMTGYAYPEMLVTVCRRHAAARRRRPSTCSTRISRSSATSSSPALGSPYASTCSRAAAQSDQAASASLAAP